MRDRKPFQLEMPLTIWNAFLAAFSSLGVIFIAPALYRVIRDQGISCKSLIFKNVNFAYFRHLCTCNWIGNRDCRVLALFVGSVKNSWIYWHIVHCFAQKAVDHNALVPSSFLMLHCLGLLRNSQRFPCLVRLP